MRTLCSFLAAALLAAAAPALHAGTCNDAYLAEGQRPPAFDGVHTGDAGLVVRYWVWGRYPDVHGSDPSVLVDDGTGVALSPGILWANSPGCSGTVAGTGVLLEEPSASSGGFVALVAVAGAEGNLDALQGGTLQSAAEPLPTPTVTLTGTGSDGDGAYADYLLSWSPPTSAVALADVAEPLAGYRVWAITTAAGGPVDTGVRDAFTPLGAAPSPTAPFVTDDSDDPDGLLPRSQTSCHVRVRPGATWYFALSVLVDGSAAAANPAADPGAVETTYVGACSAGVSVVDPLIFEDDFDDGTLNAWSTVVG